jgi:hypothetical protein
MRNSSYVLLLVAVALGLAAIASAQTQGSGIQPIGLGTTTGSGSVVEGPKCVTSSETLSMNTGACGTLTLPLTGVCAKSKEDVDLIVKLAASLMKGMSMDTNAVISEADCKQTGQTGALQFCAAASMYVGDGKTKLTVKAGLDYCKDVTCFLLAQANKAPQSCMTDAHCPKGENIKLCCSSSVNMVKKFCEVTDDQIKTISSTKMASTAGCSNDATKCFSSSAGFRQKASVTFALAMGWLAVLIVSNN